MSELEKLDLYPVVEKLTDLGYMAADLADAMSEAAEKFNQYKVDTVAQYADTYPTAHFSELFFWESYQAMKECKACATCKGYPCTKKKNPGIVRKVIFDSRLNEMCVENYICPHVKSHRLKERAEKQFANAKIPKKYLGKTFADYKVDANNQNAVNWAKKILEEPKSLYYTGNPGTGKTFLAAIIAQEYLKRGKSVIFSDVPYLLNKMRASFAEDSEVDIEEMMKTLEDCDVLVLDDLGTEVSTEWAVERLFLIINSRYLNNKQTLVTSNYSLAELAARLNVTRNGKGGITGDRIASRLREMCSLALLRGDDRRLK